MFRRVRGLWFAGVIALAVPASFFADWAINGPSEAEAALSVAYSLEELVQVSPKVAVVEAVERRSVWEKIGDSKRIVTYTKLKRVDAVYGTTPKDVWVRTLGGAVGRVGQQVAGEARFTLGKQSLVFLTQTKSGIFVVSGAAQGHYPIVVADEERKLSLSPNRGRIVKRKKTKVSIQEALGGVEVASGVSKVKSAKARVDAEKDK